MSQDISPLNPIVKKNLAEFSVEVTKCVKPLQIWLWLQVYNLNSVGKDNYIWLASFTLDMGKKSVKAIDTPASIDI